MSAGLQRRWLPRIGAGLAGMASLLVAQFAVQALFNAVVQGVLALTLAAALAGAAVRVGRRRPVAGLLFAASVPLFVFSVVATLAYSDESPIYAAVSAVPPVVAGAAWLVRRRSPRAA